MATSLCIITITLSSSFMAIVNITLVHESGDELAVLASRRLAPKISRYSFSMSLRTKQDYS